MRDQSVNLHGTAVIGVGIDRIKIFVCCWKIIEYGKARYEYKIRKKTGLIKEEIHI